MPEFEENVTASLSRLATLVEGIKDESLPGLHRKVDELKVYVSEVNGRVGKLEKKELIRKVLGGILKAVIMVAAVPAALIVFETYIRTKT